MDQTVCVCTTDEMMFKYTAEAKKNTKAKAWSFYQGLQAIFRRKSDLTRHFSSRFQLGNYGFPIQMEYCIQSLYICMLTLGDLLLWDGPDVENTHLNVGTNKMASSLKGPDHRLSSCLFVFLLYFRFAG